MPKTNKPKSNAKVGSLLERLVSWLRDERTYVGTFSKLGIVGETVITGVYEFTTTRAELKNTSVADIGFLQNWEKLRKHYTVGANGKIQYLCEYDAN